MKVRERTVRHDDAMLVGVHVPRAAGHTLWLPRRRRHPLAKLELVDALDQPAGGGVT
jgi:hypothetical protein